MRILRYYILMVKVIYIDGRSDLHSKKIQWLDEFLLNENHSIGAWQMKHNYE